MKLIGKINCVNVLEAAGTLTSAYVMHDGWLVNGVNRGLHACTVYSGPWLVCGRHIRIPRQGDC